MEVELTPDQEAFIRQAIERGRLNRREDAVQEALSLWEERERLRAELLAALDEAEAGLDAGRYADYTRRDAAGSGRRVETRSACPAQLRAAVTNQKCGKCYD